MKTTSETLREQQQIKLKDAYVEYHSSLYSSAASYDNAVVLAGFAAFFALWAGVSDDIPRLARLVTVALMGVSLMAYIAVTVGQMLMRQIHLEWRRANAFNLLPHDVEGFLAEYEKAGGEWNERQGKLARPAMAGFWLALGAGFVAGLLLAYTALGVAFGWPVLTG